jgi:N-acetylglucosamine-6-sulfatase
MNRHWLSIALATVLALLAGSGPPADPRPIDEAQPSAVERPVTDERPRGVARPNIVLVLTDDLEPSLLRFMPQVRAMQDTGATFAHFTISVPLCCPSRSSILTGQYAHTSTIYTNHEPGGGYTKFSRLGLDKQTYAVALQRAGYRTGFLGKYLNRYDPTAGDGTPGSNVPPGWNDWHVGGNAYANYNYVLNENGREVRYGNDPKSYLTDVLSRHATAFIRDADRAGQPFALQVNTFTPHSPYTPAPRHSSLYPGLTAPRSPAFNEARMDDKPAWIRDRKQLTKTEIAAIDRTYRLRAQSVRAIDDLIGNIRRTLAETGQDDNTYLLFTSDNGYHLGEHRLPAGKQTGYTTDIVVPLVVIGPTVEHRSIGQLAQNVDLAPTFVDLAGAPPLTTADGRSLAPLLTGHDPADWRTAALVEHAGSNPGRQDPKRQPLSTNPPTFGALYTGLTSYVEYADGSREFYDLRRDPHQLTNIYDRLTPAEREALTATLAELAACTGTEECQIR